MIFLRKILFYLFVLAYFIICPLIILDSLGIIITPSEKKLLTSTGLISIATIPQNASIEINEHAYPRKTPAIIRNLAPGDYKIKISLDGYKPWEKNVSVRKKQAAALENVLLIPSIWNVQTLSEESFTKLLPSLRNPFILLQKNNDLDSLHIYSLDKGFLSLNKNKDQLSGLLEQDSPYKSAIIKNIFTADQSPLVIVHSENTEKNLFLQFDASDKNPKIKDVSTLITDVPQNIFWSSENPDSIYTLNAQTLNHIDIDKKTIDSDLFPQLKGFGILDRSLYVINAQNQFIQADNNGEIQDVLSGHLAELPQPFVQDGFYRVKIFSDDLMIFLNRDGRLLSNKLPFLLSEKNVIGFSDQLLNNRMFFWSKDRLGIVNFSRSTKEGVFESGPQVHWLITGARNIRQAFWVNNGTHILYVEDDEAKIIEAENSGTSSIEKVIDVYGDVRYSDETGVMLFLDFKTHRLSAITLLPPHEIISFDLPVMIHKKEAQE